MVDRPIVDFHCDLLSYLAEHPGANAPFNPSSHCSLLQLRSGNVAFQTLALFTPTVKHSTKKVITQLKCLQELITAHPERVIPFHLATTKADERIKIALAIENGSGLLEEDEPLSLLFERIDQILKRVGPILYLSLTWNGENRFGAGTLASGGLKPDGRILLDYLAEKKIAIDLSHASDRLAYDVIEAIDKKGLTLTPLASHSNFRAITPDKRNLPDQLARAIIAKGGIIGINFVRRFLGLRPESIIDHLHHGLSLGASEALTFGADFFGGFSLNLPSSRPPFFHDTLNHSGHYPSCLKRLEKAFPPKVIDQIASLNGLSFLKRVFIPITTQK